MLPAMSKLGGIFGIAIAVSWLAAATVHAQATGEKDAKGYYDSATAMFALGKYAEAAQLYEKAFELKPDAALLYNAAQAHRMAGNKQRALALYSSLLRLYGRQLSNRANVQQRIEELKAAIAHDEKVATSPPTSPLPATVAPDKTPGKPPESSEPPPAATAPMPNAAAASAATPASPTSASPAATAPDAIVATRPVEKPLVKKPWFWATVIGGAAVAATAIALGVTFGTAHTDPAVTFGTARGN
jgi:tetratricopeptide (TPR) repeat protein